MRSRKMLAVLSVLSVPVALYAGGCANSAVIDYGDSGLRDSSGSGSSGSSSGSSSDSSGSSSGGSSGSSSGSSSDDSGGSCPPADVSTWMPPAYPHATAVPGACQGTEIDDFDTACLSSGHTQATCSTYRSAHPVCAACLESPVSATSWGAIVVNDHVADINVGGCIELTDPTNTSCPPSVAAMIECEHQACDNTCPVDPTMTTTFDAWTNCQMSADNGGCQTYAMSAQCGAIEAGPSAVCSTGSTFEDKFKNVAPIFCGGTAADGSADASAE